MEEIRYPMSDGKGNIVNDTLTEYLLYQKKLERSRAKYLLQKEKRVKKCRARKMRGAIAGLVMFPIAVQGVVSFVCNESVFNVEAKSKTSNHSYSQSINEKPKYNVKAKNNNQKHNSNIKEQNIVENSQYKKQEQVYGESFIGASVDDPFSVGSSDSIPTVIDFLSSPVGNIIYRYSEDYGVDPNIMAAICMQETSLEHQRCSPGGDRYSGYGVGLMQLESPSGQEIQAYNYNTGMTDTMYITMENACDIEKNIQIGCMIFQNSILNNNGNVCLAIQSHNYGQGMLNSVLSKYSNEKGIDINNAKSNYTDVGWVDYVMDAHNNPLEYIDEWQESRYGDGEYLYHVLRFNPSDVANYKYYGQDISINLKTLQPVSKHIY